jgi:O-antigen/teichoic acid export membrane protein
VIFSEATNVDESNLAEMTSLHDPARLRDGTDGHGTLKQVLAGTRRVATVAAIRQVVTMGVLAFTGIVVARFLGPHSFGLYAGGTAAFNLALGFCDFGFSALLLREMAKRPDEASRLMSAALAAAIVWSAAITLALIGLGLVAGGTRGKVMLILAPSIVFFGIALSRQIFTARYRARPLLILDVTSTLAQCGIMVALAVNHAPLLLLAANLSVWNILSASIALLMARRMVHISMPAWRDIATFVSGALPIGVASLLASLYFTIDLTLLGWLVKPTALAHYAAAVRLLSLVVMIPSLILTAGLPGLARSSTNREDLSEFAGTLARWIGMAVLPVGAAFAVFAYPLVHVAFGSAYAPAAPLIRILMVAGCLAFSSNVTGVTMISLGIIRPQIIFNSLSLVVNVAGNVLLVPRYGVTASAWLTVASEAIVFGYGVVVLRHRLDYRAIGGQVRGTLLAVVAGSVVGLALGANSVVSMLAAAAAFLVVGAVTGAWSGAPTGRARRPGHELVDGGAGLREPTAAVASTSARENDAPNARTTSGEEQ